MKVVITETFAWRGAMPPSKLVRLHQTRAGTYDDLPPEAIKRAEGLGILKRPTQRKRKPRNKALKNVQNK